MHLFRFQDALDIALKFNKYIDIVLWYRMKHLASFKLTETCPRFRQLFEKVGGLDIEYVSRIRKEAKLLEERRR